MPNSIAPAQVFVSAREVSGDLYAAGLVEALKAAWPRTAWFGSAGPRMRKAGVEPFQDGTRLSVVGLVEVLAHLPRIYGEYRQLIDEIGRRRPELVILSDSPDFHLRLAGRVRRMGIPVIYLVAPQAWAWREGRVKAMRRNLSRLLCLFPFEEPWYRERGVAAHYIGHPLGGMVRASMPKEKFLQKHQLAGDCPIITLCPGSRVGEVGRHLGPLGEAVKILSSKRRLSFLLALPEGFRQRAGESFFKERIQLESIQVIEGETWDALAHSDVALAASGTVTMEAALLGTPVVTYYKVTGISWLLGRLLVDVPFYSMVNLIAERRLAAELMQNEMTGERLADETLRLLEDEMARETMRQGLREVAAKLASEQEPMQRAAQIVKEFFDEHATRPSQI